MSELTKWRDYLREFAGEREWEQFHNPKNLAMALTVEAGELMELFQWLTPRQADNPDEELKTRAGEELSDVILYSIRMADKLGIDLDSAIARKTKMNEAKYPIEKAKGIAKKYTDL